MIEFDQAGKVVQGWGGDGPNYKWGNDGHGIHVDHNNFVWVGDNIETTGGHIYKFTRDGKFVLRIGEPGPGHRLERHQASRPARRDGGRSRDQRAVRRRRLRQQARHRVRRRDRRLQAPLGRLRQAAGATRRRRRGTSGLRRRRRRISPIRCIASRSPSTGSSRCATASTTACSSSARTAPSCANSSCSRRAIPARSARS